VIESKASGSNRGVMEFMIKKRHFSPDAYLGVHRKLAMGRKIDACTWGLELRCCATALSIVFLSEFLEFRQLQLCVFS